MQTGLGPALAGQWMNHRLPPAAKRGLFSTRAQWQVGTVLPMT